MSPGGACLEWCVTDQAVHPDSFSRCTRRHPFLQNILEHMDDVPVLILNSLVDTWQLFFVYGFPSENIVSVDNATVILQV